MSNFANCGLKLLAVAASFEQSKKGDQMPKRRSNHMVKNRENLIGLNNSYIWNNLEVLKFVKNCCKIHLYFLVLQLVPCYWILMILWLQKRWNESEENGRNKKSRRKERRRCASENQGNYWEETREVSTLNTNASQRHHAVFHKSMEVNEWIAVFAKYWCDLAKFWPYSHSPILKLFYGS